MKTPLLLTRRAGEGEWEDGAGARAGAEGSSLSCLTLATEEAEPGQPRASAERAFSDRGSPGLQEGRELTSRDNIARGHWTDVWAGWGLLGFPQGE